MKYNQNRLKGKQSKISSLKLHLFLPGESQRNKDDFSTEIYNLIVDNFSLVGNTHDTSHIFNVIIQDSFKSFAMIFQYY